MGVPLRQQLDIGAYIARQKWKGNKRYPLVLMLEPLFKCNLACPGCGKIDYPDPILNRRLSPQECWDAAEECGAPMVAMEDREADQLGARAVAEAAHDAVLVVLDGLARHTEPVRRLLGDLSGKVNPGLGHGFAVAAPGGEELDEMVA